MKKKMFFIIVSVLAMIGATVYMGINLQKQSQKAGMKTNISFLAFVKYLFFFHKIKICFILQALQAYSDKPPKFCFESFPLLRC